MHAPLQQHGRFRDEGEIRAIHTADGQRIAQEIRVAQQAPVQGQGIALGDGVGRPGFRHIRGDQPQRQRAQQAQHAKHGAPAKGRVEHAAGQRRQDRRQAHHHRYLPQHARLRGGVEAVAHHDPADDGAAAAAEGLQHARGDQHVHVAGEGADDAGEHKNARAGQQHGTASVTVGQRPAGEHRGGRAGHEQAQGQLQLGIAGMQGIGHGRQRRQIDVDADARQADQQQHDAAPGPYSELFLHCFTRSLQTCAPLAHRNGESRMVVV